MAEHEIDALTRTATTGHEWDGIKELNTPLPRWWVWLFYATIIWSFGYWLLYPAWPTVTGYTAGLLGYTNRTQVAADLSDLQKARGERGVALQTTSLTDIEKDPALLAFAQAQGKAAFGNNCAPCHGVGATGGIGYPNLNDDDWLWGGTVTAIQQTIAYGVRSGHPKAHESAMPAFGKNGMLKEDEIVSVANYVRSLSGLPIRPGIDVAKGKAVFADSCSSCHGEDAKGNQDLGAPNLADRIWLFGSEEAAVIDTIINGRSGVMPAWADRLDGATVNALAVYVHTLGGGR